MQYSYETLMGLNQKQINSISIEIGTKKYYIQSITTILGNDHNVSDTNTPLGFRDFITKLYNKTPIRVVLKNWFEEKGYYHLMGYSVEQIQSICIEIGDAKYYIKQIKSLLLEDFSGNVQDVSGFRDFITILFDKPNIKKSIRKRIKKQTYNKLMTYEEPEIQEKFKIHIGEATYKAKTIASFWGNNNRTNNPQYRDGFRNFITKFFNKPPIHELLMQWFHKKGYSTLMKVTSTGAKKLFIRIGYAKYSMRIASTVLGNHPSIYDIRYSEGFRKFIHFVVFKKSQEEYDEWINSNL